MRCTTPPLPPHSGDLIPASLPEYRNQYVDPNVGSFYLFPDAHYYPQYVTRLVSVEVSNNQQDFSLSGINFLYYQDETLEAIAPTQAFDSDEPLSIFAYGRNFINTTALTCRLGLQAFPATFVTSKLLLCEVAHPMVYDDSRRIADKFHDLTQPRHALFEVSNNGRDFTTSHVVFEFLGACPTGYFCPKQLQGSKGRIPCPRGTYCPGVANSVFTLCPRGTYQPKTAQAACLRCPIGYHCPHTGMHVPRLCPAGYVCDVTGIEEADQPCPEGHYCLEGTATTATTCTPTSSTGLMIASSSAAEKPTTLRRQREKAPLASMQARKSGCWRNETEDYGLQLSARPSRFWMELRQLPYRQARRLNRLRVVDSVWMTPTQATFESKIGFSTTTRRTLRCDGLLLVLRVHTVILELQLATRL
ncbi:Immunoglobulin-like fold [Phytophthora cactorum]|nr:Immunoglobulin-like fold [Phytophthora cactorum]